MQRRKEIPLGVRLSIPNQPSRQKHCLRGGIGDCRSMRQDTGKCQESSHLRRMQTVLAVCDAINRVRRSQIIGIPVRKCSSYLGVLADPASATVIIGLALVLHLTILAVPETRFQARIASASTLDAAKQHECVSPTLWNPPARCDARPSGSCDVYCYSLEYKFRGGSSRCIHPHRPRSTQGHRSETLYLVPIRGPVAVGATSRYCRCSCWAPRSRRKLLCRRRSQNFVRKKSDHLRR